MTPSQVASGSGGSTTSGLDAVAASSSASGGPCDPNACAQKDLPGDCYFSMCQGAMCEVSLVASKGTACATNGGKLCDGNGNCLGCLSTSDCSDQPNTTCVAGFCQKDGCANGTMDGQETGVDCGGPTCAKCANGGGCDAPCDCQSNFCLATTSTCSPCAVKFENVPDFLTCAVVPDTYCELPSFVCKPKKPAGGPCVIGAECLSGKCNVLFCG